MCTLDTKFERNLPIYDEDVVRSEIEVYTQYFANLLTSFLNVVSLLHFIYCFVM